MTGMRGLLRGTLAVLLLAAATTAGGSSAIAAGGPHPAASTTFINWSQFQYGPHHRSFNAKARAITAANAGFLKQVYHWKPDPPTQPGQPHSFLFASPTVYKGKIYIGTYSGYFYKLNEATGAQVWKISLGWIPNITDPSTGYKGCGAGGIVSTAAVAPMKTGPGNLVYVNGPDGYVHALDSRTGADVWKSPLGIPSSTKNDFFPWSSPTVIGGHVYVGIASHCDNPLIHGGVREYDRYTGKILHTYRTGPVTPSPSVWSSVSGDRTEVFATTGNAPGDPTVVNKFSVVRLDPNTLKKMARFQVPPKEQIKDSDFGHGGTLFSATISGKVVKMIGACDKNGIFYALRRGSLRLVWKRRIGDPWSIGGMSGQCGVASAWDGKRLYVVGNGTTINGTSYRGSIRALNPATGKPIWEHGLPAQVLGGPAVNGSGVVAVNTFDDFDQTPAPPNSNHTFLFRAGTGAQLKDFTRTALAFAQPVFADRYLIVATQSGGMYVYDVH